jgi:hypothetical protein
MNSALNARSQHANFRMVGGGLLMVLAATACGPDANAPLGPTVTESVDSMRQELISWTPLTLINGWSASSGTSPAVGLVNGIITFRGIIKGTANATDNPFVLPAAFRPRVSASGWDSVQLRLTTKDNVGATLSFLLNNVAGTYETHLRQDGLSGPGTAARTFTSLDGVTVDTFATDATEVDYGSHGWSGVYSFRSQGAAPAASAKIVNGFVRFQGHLSGGDESWYLFTLPPEMRPQDFVMVPISLGFSQSTYSYGRLVIAGNGNVWAQNQGWDWSKATAGVSLEGAAFALADSGTSAIALKNGTLSNSNRTIRARNDNGIIRLQGTVRAGSSTTVATLPLGMAPTKTVFVVADMCDAVKGRVVINTAGDITVDSFLLSSAQCGLSFDGVSFSKAQ